jgi:HSP20 family protein
MYALTRRNPFRDLLDMRENMNRMLQRDFISRPSLQNDWDLALDVAEKPDEFVVKASLPGINPDELEITYNDNLLTIKGEVKGESEDKDENIHYHIRERWSGSFSRSVSLPSTVKADAIQASYETGVLTLHLPKREEVKPRRIAVKTEDPNVIEAKSSQ